MAGPEPASTNSQRRKRRGYLYVTIIVGLIALFATLILGRISENNCAFGFGGFQCNGYNGELLLLGIFVGVAILLLALAILVFNLIRAFWTRLRQSPR